VKQLGERSLAFDSRLRKITTIVGKERESLLLFGNQKASMRVDMMKDGARNNQGEP
jgi:hypothetical protein